MLALLGSSGDVSVANAAPAKPLELEVVGGGAWRPEPSFDLRWTNPAPSGSPLAATHYRIRDPVGAEIARQKLAWVTDSVAALSVLPSAGVYTAEVWLEDADGAVGPAASVPLRFDDAQPPPVDTPRTPGWIGRAAFPLRFQLGPPDGPLPISGIRGYAAAIDSSPADRPCAALDRCDEAETTVSGGSSGELAIGTLPEGVHYLHLATVSGAGVSSAAGHTTLRVDTTDPLTHLVGVPGGWTNRPVPLTASAADGGAGMGHDGDGPRPLTAIRVDENAPRSELGSTVSTVVIGEGRHTVAYYARDAAGNIDDGGDLNGVANRKPHTASVWIDRSPPRVAFADSHLAADPDLVRVRVADRLSGPDLTRGRVEARRAGSGDPFVPLAPAPPSRGELHARWDSDAAPAGVYELRAVGYDRAGNATTTGRRRNGARMIVTSPLRTPTTLLAGFGGRTLTWHRCVRRHHRRRCRRETIASFGRRPANRAVPFGRSVRLGGKLLTTAGAPLGGAPVRITEYFPTGTERSLIAWTRPDGSFLARLAAGPSREIKTNFAGDRLRVRASGRVLGLRVRTGVRLGANSPVASVGGAPVVFRGRVATSPGAIPDDGLSVQLQFRLPGRGWTEFRTARTDVSGRFRYAYRFSDDDSRGIRFLFRAHVPAQGGWPFEPGSSRPFAVRGR